MGQSERAKRSPQLGLFVANLTATVVFGSVWVLFNLVLGNLVALRFLGWLNGLPLILSQVVALLPSGGQLLFEESHEAKARARARANAEGRKLTREEEGLDNLTLGFIALLSTTLDILGPALGIIVTVTALGGEMAVVPAVILAFIASWVCQRIAWRCFKVTLRMTWEALCEVLAAPFHTKTLRINNKRRGHSAAFQLEAPREE